MGGSSAINILFWTHASQKDIDNWGALGNDGWSWDAVFPYYKKSENYMAPSGELEKELETGYIKPRIHGRHGAVDASFPAEHGPFDEAWPRTYANLGQAVNGDPKDGLALGGYTNLISMNSTVNERSFSANAYLNPALGRKNLKVITFALIEKINFESQKQHGDLVASGLTYSQGNKSHTIKARKEVLLCAGSFGSPHILELSGIGSSSLLKKQGIRVLLDNPNVGENLQDHAMVPLGWEVKKGIPTFDDFRDPKVFEAAYEEYVQNRTGPLSTGAISSALLSYKQILHSIKGSYPETSEAALTPTPDCPNPNGRAKQYKLLYQDLHDPNECIAQEIDNAGGISPQNANDSLTVFTTTLPGHFFTMWGVLEHPFSRGSVHLQSSDPKKYPLIDPNYLSHPLDAKVLGDIGLHCQKVAQTAPLADLLKGGGTVVQKGYETLTKQNAADWVRKSIMSEYHPCGTCAMLPKSDGGVVDSKLKVYGTKNLRVVDASIFPLIPRANLQTLVYAVAERVADWIKEGK